MFAEAIIVYYSQNGPQFVFTCTFELFKFCWTSYILIRNFIWLFFSFILSSSLLLYVFPLIFYLKIVCLPCPLSDKWRKQPSFSTCKNCQLFKIVESWSVRVELWPNVPPKANIKWRFFSVHLHANCNSLHFIPNYLLVKPSNLPLSLHC